MPSQLFFLCLIVEVKGLPLCTNERMINSNMSPRALLVLGIWLGYKERGG